MHISSKILDLIVHPRHRWIQHLAFWTLMYTPHILGLTGIIGNPVPLKYIPVYLFILCLDTAAVYFNLYFLIPRFFMRQRYWQYLVLTIVCVFANACWGPSIMEYAISNGARLAPLPSQVVESFVLTFNLLMTAVGFNILKRFLLSQARLKELESASLKTELAYLKNQINPHFLFNSLNNIYVQSRTNPADASESILQLSDLLRYQLYDCTQESVNLSDEITYLQNYLNIEKMRKNKAHVDFNVHGSTTGVKVAPFLFLPFVENALKHGLSLENESHIAVNFEIKQEELVFEIENEKPEKPLPNLMNGGIGLANINRRLDLIYPDRYHLDIENERKSYKVRLSIELAN